MNAFYVQNNNNLKLAYPDQIGPVPLLEQTLDPGSYLIWGRFSAGVSESDTSSTLPYWGGEGFLVFGDAHDSAFVGSGADDGENNSSVSLMLAAKSGRSHRVRLYFVNLYPRPVYIAHARIMVLQVESLAQAAAGVDTDAAPADEDERLSDAIVMAKIKDQSGFAGQDK